MKQSIPLAFLIILSKHDLLGSINRMTGFIIAEKCWEIFQVNCSNYFICTVQCVREISTRESEPLGLEKINEET